MLNLIKPVLAQGVDLGKEYSFGEINSLSFATERLITPVFSIAAIGVTFYLIVGAFKFLTSGGNKEEVASARAMITHALIAFLLLIMMFLVLQFLPTAIVGSPLKIIK